MGLKAKLNFSILLILVITFCSLAIIINSEIKSNNSKLLSSILSRINADNLSQLQSLEKNFQEIETQLKQAGLSAKSIVTELYLNHTAVMKKSSKTQL